MTSHLTKTHKSIVAAAVSAVLLLSVAGCSTETTGGGGTAGDTPNVPAEAVADIPNIDLVPADAQYAYEGSDNFVKLQENPYTDYVAPEGPAKWCMSESYIGNTWRKLHLAQWQGLVERLAEAGEADGELQVTDSNGDAALQISQVNTLVNGGCDVLIVLPASPDALCDVMSQAKDKGVLVLTSDSVVDCDSVINVSHNGFFSFRNGVKAVAEAMGGEGDVLVVTGFPGTKGVAYLTAAYKSVLADYPDINVVGEVAGNWTPSVAQSAVATFLATHPGDLDAIWEMGEMGVAAQNALKQAGREPSLTTAASGECAAFAYWKANPDSTPLATVQSPEAIAYTTYAVAMRMLNGQVPSVNTILYPLPEVTSENFDDFYKSDMTESSLCYPRSPDGRIVPESFIDSFFSGGEPVETEPLDG